MMGPDVIEPQVAQRGHQIGGNDSPVSTQRRSPHTGLLPGQPSLRVLAERPLLRVHVAVGIDRGERKCDSTLAAFRVLNPLRQT